MVLGYVYVLVVVNQTVSTNGQIRMRTAAVKPERMMHHENDSNLFVSENVSVSDFVVVKSV
jgi:hypothetical protein